MEEIALPAGRRVRLWTGGLTVTPTTHLTTMLANWQTIRAALRPYLH